MSEYLDEEEQVARMKSWWADNGTTLIIGVVIALAVVVGWRWYGSYSDDQAFAASEAFAAYQAAQGDAKSSAGDAIATEFSGSTYHVFVLFEQAKQAVAESDLAKAEELLQHVIDVAGDALLVDLAKVRQAKVQQGLDRSAQALATLGTLSSEGYRAWGLEATGDIHTAQGNLEQAHKAYQGAIESLTAGDERPILQMKLNNVAPHDGQYIEFDNALEAALQEAQETIDSAQADEIPEEADEVEAPAERPTNDE